MKKSLTAASVLLLLHVVVTIKIGVSRVIIELGSSTTTPATTEYTTTSSQMSHASSVESATTTTATTITMLEDSTTISNSIAKETTTITIKPTSTTIKPNLSIAIFPPRLKTTKPPKISTTTSEPSKTVSESVASNTTPDPNTVGSTSIINDHSSPVSHYCDCDLLWDACDLNCCCDRDCTREALNVFDCNAAIKQPHFKNRLEDFQYEHGLPSCKVNDGWLCVFRTNTRQESEKPPAVGFNAGHYHKWSAPAWDINSEEHSNENINHYKYAEPLQFLDMKNMILKQFDLPHTFKESHCQITESIKFLKSYKTNCLLSSLKELKQTTKNLVTFIQNSKLLLKPLKDTNEPEHLTHILSDLQLKICQKDKCEAVSQTNSTALELHIKAFYATDIKFKLLHNYTQLLSGVLEISNGGNSQNVTELWQNYQVKYIYKNKTGHDLSLALNEAAYYRVAVKLTSGPLGYLPGRPIIIARFIANNLNEPLSQTNQVLNYFHPNSTKALKNHTIPLFTKNQNRCTRDTESTNLINYGINTLKQCKLRYSKIILADTVQKSNFTEICIELQTQIVTEFFSTSIFQFGKKFPELYISQLGRPENRSNKWTQLNLRNHEFAPISGSFNAQAQSFSCRNMLLNIAYEFIVGHFTESGVGYQALVKQATLVFGERNDLEFEMDEEIEVPLRVSAMFFDYSKDVTSTGLIINGTHVPLVILIFNLVIFYTT